MNDWQPAACKMLYASVTGPATCTASPMPSQSNAPRFVLVVNKLPVSSRNKIGQFGARAANSRYTQGAENPDWVVSHPPGRQQAPSGGPLSRG